MRTKHKKRPGLIEPDVLDRDILLDCQAHGVVLEDVDCQLCGGNDEHPREHTLDCGYSINRFTAIEDFFTPIEAMASKEVGRPLGAQDHLGRALLERPRARPDRGDSAGTRGQEQRTGDIMSIFKDMAKEDPCAACGWHTEGNFTFEYEHRVLGSTQKAEVCDSCSTKKPTELRTQIIARTDAAKERAA